MKLEITEAQRHRIAPWVLGLLIAIFAGATFWGYQALFRPPDAPPPPPPCIVQTVSSELSTSQVTVNVLNGGTKSGQAKVVADALAAQGFVIGYIDNAQPVSWVTVVGSTKESPEVLLVASFFPEAVLRADDRESHSVDVIINNLWEALPEGVPTTISVDTGTVCLPSIAKKNP
ncbi:MAG: LytR C-terminal domain-containing protein [Propionibacteriaceae bacterium]|nr:LytR C-terminal domain-containing protein [Propionibacteriaceae bacterium]